MSYEILEIPKEPIECKFENVSLKFEVKRDRELEENQIMIRIFMEQQSRSYGRIYVDYAKILASYNSKKDSFNPDLIDEVFLALNAELAPNGYQLKVGIKKEIAKFLRRYVPEANLPCGAHTT